MQVQGIFSYYDNKQNFGVKKLPPKKDLLDKYRIFKQVQLKEVKVFKNEKEQLDAMESFNNSMQNARDEFVLKSAKSSLEGQKVILDSKN